MGTFTFISIGIIHLASLAVVMMAVFLNNGAQGSVATGPCDKAGHGQTQEKCTMKCNYDGSCTESVIVEKCGCSGYAEFQAGAANFQVSMSCTIIYPIYHCIPPRLQYVVVCTHYFLLLGWQPITINRRSWSIGCLW